MARGLAKVQSQEKRAKKDAKVATVIDGKAVREAQLKFTCSVCKVRLYTSPSHQSGCVMMRVRGPGVGFVHALYGLLQLICRDNNATCAYNEANDDSCHVTFASAVHVNKHLIYSNNSRTWAYTRSTLRCESDVMQLPRRDTQYRPSIPRRLCPQISPSVPFIRRIASCVVAMNAFNHISAWCRSR